VGMKEEAPALVAILTRKGREGFPASKYLLRGSLGIEEKPVTNPRLQSLLYLDAERFMLISEAS